MQDVERPRVDTRHVFGRCSHQQIPQPIRIEVQASREPGAHTNAALASRLPRYGCRRKPALLRQEGWRINHKRVERLWRREGLRVPRQQPKRGRLLLNDWSCVRLRPLHRNHLWSVDFVFDRTHDGRAIRMLTVIDETTRESLAIEVGRRFRADDVLRTLTRLFVERGPPAFIRSEYGPESTATAVRIWLARLGVGVLFIAPGWFGIGFPQDAPSLEARLSEEIKAAIDNPQHHQLRKPLTFSYAVK